MSDAEKKSSGYRALRRGRISIPEARYFITIVTNDRKPSLACDGFYTALLDVCDSLPACTLAFVIMPDHIHWLFELDRSHQLPDIIRLLKGRLSPALRELQLSWQKGAYHDRRLRPDDEISPFLRYMLCNPYRKHLCELEEPWPYWYCAPEILKWFETITVDRCPQPEWILDDRLPPWSE
ncbi:MAG: REP-associated tyrosine transposase [Opitutaceae bacterium]